MSVEELLNSLREAGLDDEAISALLNEALKTLTTADVADDMDNNPTEEDDEAKVRRLLGV